MKYPTVVLNLITLAVFFLLINTTEAYKVHIYATNDSYSHPMATCVPYVTNCDGHATAICNKGEEYCYSGTLMDCEVPDGQWSCAHLRKTGRGAGEEYYPTNTDSCFAFKQYENGAWTFDQVGC
ncbi:hypothetical protein F8M41_014306 [Gigaspora margarita]|uniref:Secreted protein n=1 Tax=Gigaspora margarita TaxID=4874 RepID=A0A8H4ENQ1_GIGMA|nr:hypothetical protein F8M41_014306 [Gigaspora margarita]